MASRLFLSDDVRCVKLILLLVKGGTLVAKKLIMKISDKSIDDFLNDNENKLKCARKKKHITEKQMNILFPGTSNPTDLECWDISLFSNILLNLFDDKLESHEKVAIKALRDIRNDMSHLASFVMDEAQFLREWTRLTKVLFQLSRRLTTAEEEDINDTVDKISTITDFNAAKQQLEPFERSDGLLHEIVTEKLACHDQKFKEIYTFMDEMKAFKDEVKTHLDLKARMTVDGSSPIARDTAQAKLLNGTKTCVSDQQDQSGEQDQSVAQDKDDEVLTAIKHLFSEMRNKGVNIVKVEEGSILVTFRCPTISALKNISQYLADRMYEERMVELENALSKHVGSPVKLNISIVVETLDTALMQIEKEANKKSIVLTLKCRGSEGVKNAIDCFDNGSSTNALNSLSEALSKSVDNRIELHTTIDVDQLENHIKELNHQSHVDDQHSVQESTRPLDGGYTSLTGTSPTGSSLGTEFVSPPIEISSTETPPTEFSALSALSSTETQPTEIASTDTPTTEISSIETQPIELSPTETTPTELSSIETTPTEIPSTETPPTETHFSEMTSNETKPSKISSTETKPSKISSTETQPTEIASTETQPTKIASTETQSTEIASTETQPTKIASTKTQPTEIASTETHPTKIASTETQPTKIASIETQPTEIASTETQPTEIASTETHHIELSSTKTPPNELLRTETRSSEFSLFGTPITELSSTETSFFHKFDPSLHVVSSNTRHMTAQLKRTEEPADISTNSFTLLDIAKPMFICALPDGIRYAKLILLLCKVGTLVAKKTILKISNSDEKCIDGYLKDNKDILELARKKHYISEKQMNILFPGQSKPTDLESWDISLFSFILLDLFDDKLGFDEKVAIAALRDKRNMLARSASTIMSEVQFLREWAHLTMALFQMTKGLTKAEQEEINNTISKILIIQDVQYATKELKSFEGSDEFVHSAITKRLTSSDQRLKDVIRRMEKLEADVKRHQEITDRMIVSVSTPIVRDTAQAELLNATQRVVSRKQDPPDEQYQADQQHQSVDDEVLAASNNLFSDMSDQDVDIVKVENG